MRKASNFALTFMVLMVGLVNLPSTYAQAQDEPTREVRKTEDGPKTRILYPASRIFRLTAVGLDTLTTWQNIDAPTKAFRKDGTPLGIYPRVETSLLNMLGNRNMTGIVILTSVREAGVTYLTDRLKKGGHTRLATVANFGFGICPLIGAIGNMRENAGIDGFVRRKTKYTGAITWHW